jgi:hypothetical protein
MAQCTVWQYRVGRSCFPKLIQLQSTALQYCQSIILWLDVKMARSFFMVLSGLLSQSTVGMSRTVQHYVCCHYEMDSLLGRPMAVVYITSFQPETVVEGAVMSEFSLQDLTVTLFMIFALMELTSTHLAGMLL